MGTFKGARKYLKIYFKNFGNYCTDLLSLTIVCANSIKIS